MKKSIKNHKKTETKSKVMKKMQKVKKVLKMSQNHENLKKITDPSLKIIKNHQNIKKKPVKSRKSQEISGNTRKHEVIRLLGIKRNHGKYSKIQ